MEHPNGVLMLEIPLLFQWSHTSPNIKQSLTRTIEAVCKQNGVIVSLPDVLFEVHAEYIIHGDILNMTCITISLSDNENSILFHKK